jgi:phosphatidylinositol alpha 1,6-mannosyltransferase
LVSVQTNNRDRGNGRTEARAGLRVALVASSYNYIKDGVALTLNRLVEYLERNGVEVLVFAPVAATPAFAHAGTLAPAPSIALPARPEYRLAFGLSRDNKERLEAFRPHLLHLAVAPDLLGFSAMRTARRLGIPLVASCHTRFETYLKHYWYASWTEGVLKAYLRYAYNAAREVYVPSQSMADALRADGVTAPLKLWPRGVDTERFHPNKRSDTWRAKHGLKDNDFVVAFVSRLVREKGLDTVVATLKLLKARGIAHRSMIVGDGPERQNLESRLPGAVFTGFLHGDDLAEAYAAADVFLFPSLTKTFGSVTLEAMASGLPCVCADATGSRSLVVENETGHLVEPENAQAFAARIAALAEDPAKRKAMGAAARQRSLAFSWDECMGRLLGYYRNTVETTR